MNPEILLSPPAAFCLALAAIIICGSLFSRLAFRNQHRAAGTGKAYACGEESPDNLAQPDYSQFFPFAFFFTIAHVATLIITTISVESPRSFATALIYIAAVVTSLVVLFRR